MVQTKPCFLLLLRKEQETSLTLNNGGVIEIVLYLNGVLHKTIFAARGELCVLNVVTLCEYVIDLCVHQTNL